MRLALSSAMNAIFAAPIGLAAALVSTGADAAVQAAEVPSPEPADSPAAELTAKQLAPEPAPYLLTPEPAEAAAPSKGAEPEQICDDKCKFIALTETLLPNTGAADLLSVALQPEEHALTIPSSDGTPVLSIMIDPTKIRHGKAVVATAKF